MGGGDALGFTTGSSETFLIARIQVHPKLLPSMLPVVGHYRERVLTFVCQDGDFSVSSSLSLNFQFFLCVCSGVW